MNFFKEMKKSKHTILVLILLCMSVVLFATDGLSFELNGAGTGYIVNAGNATGKVIIPAEHSTLPVVEIGDFMMSDITAIIIPESVLKISPWAFFGSENLIEVYIPITVTDIGDGAFLMIGSNAVHPIVPIIFTYLIEKPDGWVLNDFENWNPDNVKVEWGSRLPATGPMEYERIGNFVRLFWGSPYLGYPPTNAPYNFTSFTGYTVHRILEANWAEDNLGTIVTQGRMVTNALDTNVTNLGVYKYTIVAWYRHGESKGPHPTVVVSFFDPPTDPVSELVGYEVELSWTAPDITEAPAGTYVRYHVYRDGERIITTPDPLIAAEFIDLLEEDGLYIYEIFARYFNASGFLGQSDPLVYEVNFVAPRILVDPSRHPFGMIFRFQQSLPKPFVVSNNGGSVVKITNIEITGEDEHFILSGVNWDSPNVIELANQESTTFNIVFKPEDEGIFTAFLSIRVQRSLNEYHTYRYRLTGIGGTPRVDIEDRTTDFGAGILNGPSKYRDVTIRSVMSGFEIKGIALGDDTNFRLANLPAQFPHSLPIIGNEVVIRVYFEPVGTRVSMMETTLLITDGNDVVHVGTVMGRGITIPPVRTLQATLGDSYINLTWTPPSVTLIEAIMEDEVLVGFRVEKEVDEDGTWNIVETITIADKPNMLEATRFKDVMDLTDITGDVGKVFNYRVIAIYKTGLITAGAPEYSIPLPLAAPVTFVPPPPQIHGAPVNGNNVFITWESPMDAEVMFNVYRRDLGDEDSTFELLTLEPILDTHFVDANVPNGTFVYAVTAILNNTESAKAITDEVEIQVVSECDEVVLVTATELLGNFPNPFNPQTTIRFALVSEADVVIEIFNVRGQKVKTLVDGIMPSGNHTVVWAGTDAHGQNVGSGVYFYRMTAGDYTSMRRMILMK